MKTRMTRACTMVRGSQQNIRRTVRWFGHDIEEKTTNCINALRHRTNEQALLRLAGGNKWLARRAIEIYKLQIGYAEPESDSELWINPTECDLYGYVD